MQGRVAIVTDSTAYLPAELTARHDITVVPLQIIIGGAVCDEGQDVTAADVASALRRWAPVSTSRPSPQRFANAYADAAAAGAEGAVSIHLSAEMSGTVESAQIAAKESDLPVRVVDARCLGMGLGFPVLAAADAAANGAGVDEAAEAAERRAAATRSLFYVDTLEHLRRGGRIGAASTLLGSALMVKPLLHIVDGRICPLEKVRTAARAITRLEDLAVREARDRSVDLAVHHLANSVRADTVAARLRERVPGLSDLYVSEVGAVIGAHVGPGMVAVVISPR
ncbi:MAG: DegV family protein [Streptosporangiaceae bacterium]